MKKDDTSGSANGTPLSVEQLRAYEWGWGAKLMPVKDGWKLHYYSTPSFEEEPGTVYSTLVDAIEALSDILPAANSLEQKERARADLARLHATEEPEETASA